jgi:hypothetical protein
MGILKGQDVIKDGEEQEKFSQGGTNHPKNAKRKH